VKPRTAANITTTPTTAPTRRPRRDGPEDEVFDGAAGGAECCVMTPKRSRVDRGDHERATTLASAHGLRN
jgi:hypothetical protein